MLLFIMRRSVLQPFNVGIPRCASLEARIPHDLIDPAEVYVPPPGIDGPEKGLKCKVGIEGQGLSARPGDGKF